MAGFVGFVSFSYNVSDGLGGTGSAEVVVKVGDIRLCDDRFTILSDSDTLKLDVLVNDGVLPEGFPIREDGSVCDVSVVRAEPSNIFNRNAVRAVLRWKFKPRIIDGRPVPRKGQQTIEFRLDQEVTTLG